MLTSSMNLNLKLRMSYNVHRVEANIHLRAEYRDHRTAFGILDLDGHDHAQHPNISRLAEFAPRVLS